MEKELKILLKSRWKKYISENPTKKRTIGRHHYFRTRYSSRFWLKEIDNLITNLIN